jgi:hypothetical protein
MISLPNSLVTIGGYAFRSCSALESLEIPDSVESIGGGAFDSTSARLYASIGSTAAKAINQSSSTNNHFYVKDENGKYDNVKLKYTFSEGASTGLIAKAHNSSITTAVIPAGVTEIDNFYECDQLTSVEIEEEPGLAVTIKFGAFRYCDLLDSVSLPNTLRTIEGYAFADCPALQELTIPDGLTSVTDKSFLGGPTRRYISFGSTAAKAFSKAGLYFHVAGEKYRNVQIKHTVSDEGEITGTKAKAHDKSIITAEIPSGVTEIESTGFYNCDALQSVVIPDSVKLIETTAFNDCAILNSVTIPVTGSLQQINGRAFGNCPMLFSLTLPNGITDINNTTFSDFSGRLYVTPETQTAKTLSRLGKYFYLAGDENRYNNVKVLHTLSDEGEITGLKAAAHNTTITSAVFPVGVTEIAYQGFMNCENLQRIEIPEGVTTIGEQAFYQCSILDEVNLPESLETINGYAFRYCSALQSLRIPDGVTSIADSSFTDCPVRLYANIGSNAAKTISNRNKYFYVSENGTDNVNVKLQHFTENDILKLRAAPDSTSITEAVIPEGVTTVNDGFRYCASLTSLTLPESLEKIGDRAFNGCTSLYTFTIPAGVTSIGTSAFPKSNETLKVYCQSGAVLAWVKSNQYPFETPASPGGYCYSLIHDWEGAEPVWSDGYSAVTTTRICRNDVSHTETEIRALTESPTETESGKMTITIQQSANTDYSEQSDVFDVPALGTLTGLKLPDQLQSIEAQAFMDDESFQYAVIPDTCTTIGSKAFANCSGLIYIKIPATVAAIASDAFEGCGWNLVIDRLEALVEE